MLGAPTAEWIAGDRQVRVASRWWSGSMAAVGVLAVVSAGVFWLVHSAIIDDSYITLSYARNVALHGHWGLIPQRTSNTATSPLNVLLLAGFTVVLRHPVWALAAVFVAANMVLGLTLRATARALGLREWGVWAAWLVVLGNPLLLSAVGLEVTLTAAVLGALLAAAVLRRPWLFGLCAGLAVLTRIDLAVIVLVVFAAAAGLWRGWWKVLLGGTAVALPWFAFSWRVLGSAVPDTLAIKTQQKAWGSYQFGNGPLLYLRSYPAATVLAFLPALLGVLALVVVVATRARRRLVLPAALGAAGVVHYLAYTALGVPPYHWYYAPSLICLSMFLALAVSAARPAALALVAVPILGQVAFDAHHGLPWRQAAITTNWATPAQYATLGTQLAALTGGRPVHAGGEIGAIAYFCDCAVVDGFSDRAELLPIIDTVIDKASPAARALLELNYRFLDRTTP
ncbi:hypothetical protein, partial [Amycolatopsis rhizosphaerae]